MTDVPYDVVCSSHDRQRWLAARYELIGASESAYLFPDACPPWGNRALLLQSKVYRGAFDATSDEKLAMYWGSALEDDVIDALNDGVSPTGQPLIVDGYTGEVIDALECKPFGDLLRYRDVPCIGATPDAVCPDGSLVEVKNPGEKASYYWQREGGPSLSYRIQCQHQMAVTGAERAYLAALFGGRGPVYVYAIERDDMLIATLIHRCREFWNEVERAREETTKLMAG